MSTDQENAQAGQEGYWPVAGHESHGIDAHVVKTWVKEFIAKHSALAESLPAIPQEILADETAQKAGPRSPSVTDTLRGILPVSIAALLPGEPPSDPEQMARDAHRKHLKAGLNTSHGPIETVNPSDILQESYSQQILRSLVPRPQAANPPEDVSPVSPGYGRKRR